MGTQRETSDSHIQTSLAYLNGTLCVLAERRSSNQQDGKTLKLWYPIRDAQEAEVSCLVGRPLTEVDPKEGVYVDEEGTVFQLAEKGETKPILSEEIPEDGGELEHLLAASLKNGKSAGNGRAHALRRTNDARKKKPISRQAPPPAAQSASRPVNLTLPDQGFTEDAHPLNLRQKLAEVRRRIGYIQKRGFNERNNYSYVTAADLAGAVGDILAELGVVIVPSLESIAYEAGRNGGGEVSRSAQVVMSYTFTDVDSGEAITAKVAGQGLDSGDKAPYKAMTGALKYACSNRSC